MTLQVPRCPARRPTTAPSAPRAGRLAEAGSYLNVGSEENGGERLSAGETGSRSCALAPFPGERGWEGGSGERREGEREESGCGCGWFFSLPGSRLPAPSWERAGGGRAGGCPRLGTEQPGVGPEGRPSPRPAALSSRGGGFPREGSAVGSGVRSNPWAGGEGVPQAVPPRLYLSTSAVTWGLRAVSCGHG